MKENKSTISKPFILVVEDDLDDRDTFDYAFNYISDCCNLQFVEDGNKAIQLLNTINDKELPALIVLDYNLPGSKGCEIIKELDKIERIKPIPKVIYSTYSDQGIINSCMKSGAKGYFKKSNTMSGVMRDIDNLLKFISTNNPES